MITSLLLIFFLNYEVSWRDRRLWIYGYLSVIPCHGDDTFFSIVPGQCLVLHALVSWLAVPHTFPPWAGAGFVQVLCLVSDPGPHDVEQEVHRLQADHCPSTESIWCIILLCKACLMKEIRNNWHEKSSLYRKINWRSVNLLLRGKRRQLEEQ